MNKCPLSKLLKYLPYLPEFDFLESNLLSQREKENPSVIGNSTVLIFLIIL